MLHFRVLAAAFQQEEQMIRGIQASRTVASCCIDISGWMVHRQRQVPIFQVRMMRLRWDGRARCFD